MDNPIILALDGIERELAGQLAKRLQGKVWGCKVNDLFFGHGREILDELTGRIFLDVKVHDIPNTVANIMRRLAKLPAEIITVHASGGPQMVRAATQEAPGRIAAVTVPTALDEATCRRIFGVSAADQVRRLAEVAVEGGASYLVSSAHELSNLADINLIKIVPGIRPRWYAKPASDDQRRIVTPAEAIAAGANLLVIGRPILTAADPLEAVERTLEEIQQG